MIIFGDNSVIHVNYENSLITHMNQVRGNCFNLYNNFQSLHTFPVLDIDSNL